VDLDEYIIMPNHVHGIIIINEMDIHGRGEVTSPTMERTIPNAKADIGKYCGVF
jgi:hypothetical protein